MAAPKHYGATLKGVMMWANSELEHVGRIAAVEDPDIQHSYALSTVNGMAHLKDALFELFMDDDHANHRVDIKKKHDAVIRVMKHLIREYQIDLEAIRKFNVRGVLSNLGYLENGEPSENTNAENNGVENEEEAVENMLGGRRKRSTRKRSTRKRKAHVKKGRKSRANLR